MSAWLSQLFKKEILQIIIDMEARFWWSSGCSEENGTFMILVKVRMLESAESEKKKPHYSKNK